MKSDLGMLDELKYKDINDTTRICPRGSSRDRPIEDIRVPMMTLKLDVSDIAEDLASRGTVLHVQRWVPCLAHGK